MSGKRDAPITRTNVKDQFQNFDQAEIISKQKLLQIKYHEAIQNQSVIFYQKMKYHGLIYQIGQFVELFNFKSKVPYVAKINKIISVDVKKKDGQDKEETQDQIPFLQVQWYMNKSEISEEKIANNYFKCLSINQLFASKDIFYIYIQSLISKCQVLNFKQYWNISQTSPGIYFSRAEYNSKTKVLNPAPNTWNKFCYCKMPYNPDLQYVECQNCHEWIHSDCDPQQCSKDQFVCKKCRTNFKIAKKK